MDFHTATVAKGDEEMYKKRVEKKGSFLRGEGEEDFQSTVGTTKKMDIRSHPRPIFFVLWAQLSEGLDQDASAASQSSMPLPGSPAMASIPMSLHLTAMSLLLLLPSAAGQSPRNITLGSSLRPRGDATSLASPSGDFAVGFRPLDSDSSLFLLAVWFTRAPDQAVVWAANRNRPVKAGSKLELGSDGRLVLSDQADEEVWSARGANVTHAAMLNSGNFVLVSAGSTAYGWESFGDPTDTILPSQVLQLGRRLTSGLMDSDYSDGRFQLRVQGDGNLVFYLSASPSCPSGTDCDTYAPYWSTNTVGDGQQLVFSGAGDVYFALRNGTSVSLTSANAYPPREIYQRATLDPDGVLRHYVYPRNGTSGQWTVAASLAADICIRLRTGVGSGVCGYNSYCQPDAARQRVDCVCPPQYSFVDPARKYMGCKPDFAPQSCEVDSGGVAPAGEFRIERMPNTNWFDGDYERLQPVNEDTCRRACLGDCFCAVAIHSGGVCWKKRFPLSNGRYDNRDAGIALLKVARDPNSGSNNNSRSIPTPEPPNPPLTRKRSERRTWLLVLLGGGNCVLLAAVFLLTFCFYHRKLHAGLPPEPIKLGSNLRAFTYKELEEATHGFKEELGRGAYGVVYKGLIESDSRGTPIAVKRLHDLDEAVEKEFENEVRIIAQTHHKNLVRLLGYCSEGPRRLLVYEYMSNGSLSGLLVGSTNPHWNTRVQIAFGVARGLLYLHEECSTQIIHCDIKPQNILIDDHFTARISDFGLSKLLPPDQSRTQTVVRGTRGYVAPEWFKHMAITSKVDVYSFGVLLLEIVCCRRSVEPEVGEGEKAVLAYWAYDCFRAGRLDELVEDEQGPLNDAGMLERLVRVALWCIQEEPSLRPTMKKVTQMLEGAAEVAVPPDPSPNISSIN